MLKTVKDGPLCTLPLAADMNTLSGKRREEGRGRESEDIKAREVTQRREESGGVRGLREESGGLGYSEGKVVHYSCAWVALLPGFC